MAIDSGTAPLSLRIQDFLVDRRVRLSVAIYLAGLLINLALGRQPHNLYDFSDPISWIGPVLVLIGVGLRSWAAGILRKGKALTTTGPYAVCRHPLYMGTALIFTGFALIFPGLVGSLPTLAALLVIFWCTMCREERRIGQKYGPAWEAYTARTGRLVTLRLPTTMLHDWSVTQWLRSREYNAAFSSMAALIGLALWSAFL